MSDGKEIPKYYDFSYLLHPAEHLPAMEAATLLKEMDIKYATKLVSHCLVLSLVMDGDLLYEKNSRVNFTGTEKNITNVLRSMRTYSPQQLTTEMIAAFTHQPNANNIYRELLNFELAMAKRGDKMDPIRSVL